MPIQLGSNAIKSVYLGSTGAKAVYLGSQLVWQRGMTPWTDDFNRADAPLSSGNWSKMVEAAGYPCYIVDQQASGNPTLGANVGRYGYYSGVNTAAGWPITDRFKATAVLAPPATELAEDNWTSIILGWNGSSASSTFIALMVSTGVGCKTITNSIANVNNSSNYRIDNGATTLASTAAGVSASARSIVAFAKIGASAYQGYIDGNPLMAQANWAGLPDGVAQGLKRPGICIEGNHPFAQPRFYSPNINTFTVEDL